MVVVVVVVVVVVASVSVVAVVVIDDDCYLHVSDNDLFLPGTTLLSFFHREYDL